LNPLAPDLPESFRQTIIGCCGAEGEEWLRNLPGLLSEFSRKWRLAVGPPIPDLSMNFVAPAVREDGTEAILKLGPYADTLTEIDALRLYDGAGCVRMLEVERERKAFLLERLRPGAMLSEIRDDDEAVAIAAGVMGRLWRPAPPDAPFPSVADWAYGLKKLRPHFGGTTGPFPGSLVEEAEALFEELIPSQSEPVLLHGDLHHFNILSDERRGWLVIDPKGVIGEPEYEIGAYLRNEFHDRPDPKRLTARRLDGFAEHLGLDRERMRKWSLAQAVLSAWWTAEDSGEGEGAEDTEDSWIADMIDLAQILSEV
jgi:streptomycin 6-kinase